MNYTPPLWVRHFTPWWVLNFINAHLPTCWTGMVMWKQGYDWEWWPNSGCFDPHDYCRKFDYHCIPIEGRIGGRSK